MLRISEPHAWSLQLTGGTDPSSKPLSFLLLSICLSVYPPPPNSVWPGTFSQ